MKRIMFLFVFYIASIIYAFVYGIHFQKEKEDIKILKIQTELIREKDKNNKNLCLIAEKEEQKINEIVKISPSCSDILNIDIYKCVPK